MSNVIVMFEDTATTDQIEQYVNEINTNGGNVRLRYDPVMKGFAASLTEALFVKFQSFAGQGIIKYIEQDGTVTTQ